MPVIQEFMSRQFMVFVVTGSTAAAINFGSRILYNLWLSFSTAIILAYLTGMITAFMLARLFVFKNSQQPIKRSAMFFTLVNVAAILQTWIISLALAFHVLPALEIQAYVKEIAHAIGVAVPVFTSYIGHKRLSFR